MVTDLVSQIIKDKWQKIQNVISNTIPLPFSQKEKTKEEKSHRKLKENRRALKIPPNKRVNPPTRIQQTK